MSHSAVKFRGYPFNVSENLGYRKILCIIGVSRFSVKNFWSHSAYFSPNYKYFDQLLQTVKNKTTVSILVFKEFLQTSIPPLISVLYAKGYHDFPLKNFRLTVPKNFVEEPVCVSEKFGYRKKLRIRGGGRGYHDFLSKIFCLTMPKIFVGTP